MALTNSLPRYYIHKSFHTRGIPLALLYKTMADVSKVTWRRKNKGQFLWEQLNISNISNNKKLFDFCIKVSLAKGIAAAS